VQVNQKIILIYGLNIGIKNSLKILLNSLNYLKNYLFTILMEHKLKTCNDCKCQLTENNKQNKYRMCKACHSLKEKERHALYRLLHEDKIKEYGKQYRENNKEEIKERMKLYIENNKEKVREQASLRMRQKVNCSCGQVLSKSSYKKHQTSFNHFYPNIDHIGGTNMYYCWNGNEWNRIISENLEDYKGQIWIPRIK